MNVAPAEKVQAKRNESFSQKLKLELRPGYHLNSNTPSDEYLIPLKLTWNPGPLQPEEVVYPKPEMQKYDFAEKPLSVFSGTFEVTTKFKVPADAPAGLNIMTGKVRYQACNDRECLRPVTLNVQLPVEIQ